MKKNVVLYKKIPDEQKKRLEAQFNLIYFNGVDDSNHHQFIEALKNAEGMIGTGVNITQKELDFAPHLKAISTISVGYDNFDVEALTQRGIRLMHTPDVLTDTTADLIFMLLMATARRATELSSLVREGRWQTNIGEEYYGMDVHHKTVGILGMGRIGQAVAKRAYCGFDMPILYMSNKPNKTIEQQYQARYCSLEQLLRQSDFICITLPLTKSTEKLISADKLALMQPHAILINGARGKIIDESALIHALQKKTIRAAGLDVFEIEPLPQDSPLLTLPNVVLLPHIGSATQETRAAMVNCAVDNLINALKTTKPTCNWVNPAAG